MLHRLALLAPLALLACAPTGPAPEVEMTVDSEGAAQAASTSPQLTAVAEALNARQGTSLSAESDLTITGAEARGNQLYMQFRHNQPASAFGPAARESYEIVAARTLRQNLCAEPALARFVDTYGLAADITTNDGQPLATVAVDDC
ncbi:hypothetical protein [Palleronia abyssalis]|uniref:Lipoprotein n=1 Tax=Palleronia abyssalis TaxID=1501240 RepID=A0A2R8BUY9_9RHOB|nr:hypothetical protein [Palleronia abyssalis]SPJ23978.1 hypothetical protein PAA8504_01800 [Palleronia abyssalis]